MNNVIKYPKEFQPPSGISPLSVFIKGPPEWQDEVVTEFNAKYSSLTLIIAADEFSEYDIKHAQEAELVLVYFKGIDVHNALLFPITHSARFRPMVYTFIDGRVNKSELIKLLADMYNATQVQTVSELIKRGINAFSYLTEPSVASTIEVKKKRGRPKKM